MDKMSIYAKFVKEILSRKIRLRDDENVVLAKKCSSIIQRKLPPKLIDPGRFIIMCSIWPVKVNQALCDLGERINLMSLSLMRRLCYRDPKSNHITLTLADRFVTYPFIILEDMIVKVHNLAFITDFVILDILEDAETLLILWRLFMATGRGLIDVELGELSLRFKKLKVVLNVLESIN